MIHITKQFSEEKIKHLNKKHHKIITKHQLLSSKEVRNIFLVAVAVNIIFVTILILTF